MNLLTDEEINALIPDKNCKLCFPGGELKYHGEDRFEPFARAIEAAVLEKVGKVDVEPCQRPCTSCGVYGKCKKVDVEPNNTLVKEAIAHAEDLKDGFIKTNHYGLLYTHSLILKLVSALAALRAQLEQAQEALKDCESAFKFADTEMRTRGELLEQAQAELEERQADIAAVLSSVHKAEADADRMREALEKAADAIESWGGYASEYFQNKHDLQGDIDAARSALEHK